MAGLVPAIHESFDDGVRVDARDKPGHDDGVDGGNRQVLTDSRLVTTTIATAIKGQPNRSLP
jgi:hypothetical protein